MKVKDVCLRLDAFKEFVKDGIMLTERALKETLFFGQPVPEIDLKGIEDVIGNTEPFYSILKYTERTEIKGQEHMMNLMKSIEPSKRLIDTEGKWNLPRAREYLNAKSEFLRLLMKGKDIPGHKCLKLLILRCVSDGRSTYKRL